MSYHIVTVDAQDVDLKCRNKQLVCSDPGGKERSVPLEDVGSLVVTGYRATFTKQLLVEAANFGVSVVICDGYKPASVVLPVNRSTDTLLSRAHISLHARQRSLLWRKTVSAKIRNQHLLCSHLAPNSKAAASIAALTEATQPNAEATAARYYWRAFAKAVGDDSFTRNREAGGLNSLLNYGYAVLLSVVVQKLLAVGLDPTFGIAHAHRERSLPLAYDLMEPFRPCIDWTVLECFTEQGCRHSQIEVNRSSRQRLSELMVRRVKRDGRESEISTEIEGMIFSFREAVMERKPSLYKPWILTASKWDGCW